MVTFGKQYLLVHKLSFWGKLGFFIHGHPHIAKYLQSNYFKKNIKNFISQKTKNVLDIGCGEGDYAFYLAEKYPRLKIDAIDIDASKIKQAKISQKKIRQENINFIHNSGNLYGLNNKYDVIYCVEMFHAVQNKFGLLKKIKNILKKDGYFYFQDHLKNGYATTLTLSSPQPFQEYQKKFLRGNLWKKSELIKQLEKLNFTILKITNIIGFFGQLAWELDQTFQFKKNQRLKVTVIPLIKLLCILDFVLSFGKKNEIIIIAKKTV